MRLTVLGGSAAGPNPGQGCSGYLIESGATQVVIDLGPGTLLELRKHVNFRAIDGIVLSHMHLDHTLDLFALRYALSYNPIAPERPLPLWLPPGGLAALGRLAQALAENASEAFFATFSAKEYDPESALAIGELRVRFHPTAHFSPCWAMRVARSEVGEVGEVGEHGNDSDLFYTADTGPSANFIPFGSGSRVVIAEGTERGQPSDPLPKRGHLTPTEAGNLAQSLGAKTLILTHLWVEDDPRSALAAAQAVFGGEVQLAMPGLRLDWPSPSD